MTGDEWISIEGEVVGWLTQLDDDELDTAVVRVDRWKKTRSRGNWRYVPFGLPVLVLRWLGNDWSHLSYGTVARESNDEVNLGDRIAFSTTEFEQEQYAAWN